MSKSIKLDGPEIRAGLNALNAYIAEVCGYTYKPKRERTPQEKAKRAFGWGFWQKQRWYMDKYLDFIIEPSISDEVDMFGSKITLTLIDKATGKKTSETLSCCNAHNKMCEYQKMALSKKRAQ